MDLGYGLHEDDIWVVRGPKRFQDILECWHVKALHMTTREHHEIASTFTLTELARKGLRLEKATSDSPIYGDYLAVLK